MIPNSMGALLAFLGLVAPGVVFESLRQRRRPGVTRTSFQEASRTALASFLFTVISTVIVLLAGRLRPGTVADVHQWSANTDSYVTEQPLRVAWTLLAIAVLACVIAALSERVSAGGARPTMTDHHPWFIILRLRVPPRARPWLHVVTTGETEFYGYLAGYSMNSDPGERDLNLCGPRLQVRRRGEAKEVLSSWAFVSLRASEVAWMTVTYVADDGSGVVDAKSVSTVPVGAPAGPTPRPPEEKLMISARTPGVGSNPTGAMTGEGLSPDHAHHDVEVPAGRPGGEAGGPDVELVRETSVEIPGADVRTTRPHSHHRARFTTTPGDPAGKGLTPDGLVRAPRQPQLPDTT